MSEFRKINLDKTKTRISIYKPNTTWVYGHKDSRRSTTILTYGSTDTWLAEDINYEIKASGFDLKNPELIGKIIACWNGKEKRVCQIINNDDENS